jgi:hypothetical protein
MRFAVRAISSGTPKSSKPAAHKKTTTHTTAPRPKKGTNPLTEPQATHWPNSFRELVFMNDPRLPKCT